ncbi:anthranilate synthase component I family protein [Microbacterium sp. TNHR37B]|uniref:anthranilate synthase component I family protein n=1 Tax=Microbacterium sp. TNHR37B TaxID=1775956 RepID=UPI0007B301F5|nr:anthranilate synthase component I family protein [Microbacterium sp. TNHR37B]KZE90977.1 Anthranilate synthase component 1 [Microbacterium sp. TNHR37B]
MPSPLVSRPFGEWIEPVELYLGGPAQDDLGFWLDAGQDAGTGWSYLGIGDSAAGAPRDLAIGGQSAVAGAPPFQGGWVGWLDYDDAAARAGAPSHRGSAAPGGAGVHVRRLVAADHATRRLWLCAPTDELDAFELTVRSWRRALPALRAPEPVPAIARHTAAAYARLIGRCREAIREGDAYQLCLTTRFTVEAVVDPVTAYLRLRAATPSHHGGIIRVGPRSLVSASPERFLEISAGTVRTHPIKGTRPRGATGEEDRQLIDELRASAKERAENVMIVDLMRNDLQRVCVPGSVVVDRLLDVESYAAVHQLVSAISGTLTAGARIGEVLDATFPAGSMTGAPKLSAMSILHALEGAERGVFAGCFGWIGQDGAADLAMVIRSIVFEREGVYVGAGGGITWHSDASAEVAEVGVKARGPLAALGATLPPGWD